MDIPLVLVLVVVVAVDIPLVFDVAWTWMGIACLATEVFAYSLAAAVVEVVQACYSFDSWMVYY